MLTLAAPAESTLAALKALLASFRGGGIPQTRVDATLALLGRHNAVELLAIARCVNADATLTELTPRIKIERQIATMVRRVWKTSDNVNH